MKILVITRSEWSDQNSIGNTISNIFGNIEPSNIANISFRGDGPQNSICEKYFIINENLLLEKIGFYYIKKIVLFFTGKKKVKFSSPIKEQNSIEKKLVSYFRGSHNKLIYILQDYLWRFPWWKTHKLHEFLNDFKPDIIFFPSFGIPYTHRVARYIAKTSSTPLVAFHADDYYFQSKLKLGFVDKLFSNMRSNEIHKTITCAGLNYAISLKQAKIYSEYFGFEFKVLKKGVVLNSEIFSKRVIGDRNFIGGDIVVNLIYAGSLAYGRWKTIALLVNAINNLQSKGVNFKLDIYSQYMISDDIRSCIVVDGVSSFLGSVLAKDLSLKLSETDIVLHVESFDDEDIELTRYSFSTKIIDCLGSFACLLGFGPPNISSMEFLVENNLGIVCISKTDIERVLLGIYEDVSLLEQVSNASRDYVIRNHDVNKIYSNIYLDFNEVIGNFKGQKT